LPFDNIIFDEILQLKQSHCLMIVERMVKEDNAYNGNSKQLASQSNFGPKFWSYYTSQIISLVFFHHDGTISLVFA